jgi:hypothetical protein
MIVLTLYLYLPYLQNFLYLFFKPPRFTIGKAELFVGFYGNRRKIGNFRRSELADGNYRNFRDNFCQLALADGSTRT